MLKYLNWWLNTILEYIKKQTERWTNHKRPFIVIQLPFCLWKLIYGTRLVRRGTDMAVAIESVHIAQGCQRHNRYQEWFYKRSAISHLLYLKIKSDSCPRWRPELSPEQKKGLLSFSGKLRYTVNNSHITVAEEFFIDFNNVYPNAWCLDHIWSRKLCHFCLYIDD